MAPPTPSPGTPIDALPTPTLLLDAEAFEANIAALQSYANQQGVTLRPHAKAHRCAEIARRQVQAGATGICVQTIGEAEVFAAEGLRDILITNVIVDAAKLVRVARLAQQVRLALCVDTVAGVVALAEACSAEKSQIDVLIELNVGQNRCGVDDLESALALARVIARRPNLRLRGLQAYHGGAQHLRDVAARRQAVREAGARARAIKTALGAEGFPAPLVTGSGTGTFALDAGAALLGEWQAGSYCLMDADYRRNQPFEPGERAPSFRQALFVLGQVISARADRMVVDAGLKSFSAESGPPELDGELAAGWQVLSVSDEHTTLIARTDVTDTARAPTPALGTKLMLTPSHCDPTVNLHDTMAVVRHGRLEAWWPVSARGKSA
jgi:D-serine deaminase-like pyridoxal phosphate-dependent protein